MAPALADDCHLYHDLYALIQPGAAGAAAGLPEQALLVTSLQPSAPLILLNVSLGDQAELSTRACGCPLAALGWPTHLQRIRSFEKLNAGGAMLVERDVIRILEDVLPRRFGGGPTDFQLLEREGEGGHPRLSLVVHPRLGQLDESAVRDGMLGALAAVDGDGRRMADAWRRAGWLDVVRRAPTVSEEGKLLHLFRDLP